MAKLPELIEGKVIGQRSGDENCTFYSKKSCRIKDPNRPIGSFIFLGQTGVGKHN
jgi:ATP-dependent Clp protease ATP-binding subunit ClpC